MTTFFQGGAAMQLLTENDFIDEGPFTIDDIFALPEGQRAELIDGQIYDMATPNRMHQTISFSIARTIADHIDAKTADVKCIWLHLPSLYKTISKIMWNRTSVSSVTRINSVTEAVRVLLIGSLKSFHLQAVKQITSLRTPPTPAPESVNIGS